jgi:hypothetical protein
MTEPTATWADLGTELGAWAEAGRPATLWWRDDDATRPGPALDRLLALTAAARVPLALAVIPAFAEPALRGRLDDAGHTHVLVHGLAHANHAPEGEKKQELGPHRPIRMVLDDASAGLARLRAFRRLCPVLTPPWNRIADAATGGLAARGFRGLSAYGPRTTTTVDGVTVVNTHVDLIDWKNGRRFVGETRALGRLVSHLRDRRTGRVDTDEATGLLSHHAVHDAETWAFCARLTDRLGDDAAVAWRAAPTLFPLSEAAVDRASA